MKTSLVTTALFAALAGTAAADTNAPPAGVTPLLQLVGNWKGSGTMTMGDQSLKVTLAISCTKTAAGWGVECHAKFGGIPGGTYEESDLFGFDAGTQMVHWYAITNGGEVHDHAGKFDDAGRVLTVEHDGTVDGKPFKEDIVLTFDKGTISVRSEGFVDGKSASLLEATAKKKKH